MLRRPGADRKAMIVCVVAFGTLCGQIFAQSGPREQNKISVLRSDGTMMPLPLEAGTIKSKMKLGGFAGAKTDTEIPGKQASVRLKTGEAQAFVMSLAAYGPSVSYDSLIAAAPGLPLATLYKLEVNKKADMRDVPFVETTGFAPVYSKSKGMTDFRGIPLNFSRYDDHSVRIEPRSPLMPGEYAFAAVTVATDPYAAQNQTLYYCFGVDYGEASSATPTPGQASQSVLGPPDPAANIQAGKTTQPEIISMFGQPQRTANVGTKVIFFYKDLKVTFENGVVADVQ
jgi:hypothetical protein